jgi:pyridoxal phosphate enzyme (YggS family)
LEPSESLEHRYKNVCQNIEQYCDKYSRNRDSVKLIAVSKRHPGSMVVALAKLGQQDFAENYLQEGVAKIEEVQTECDLLKIDTPLVWHFIGHIQSRKCRDIAENFDWVHTVESEKVATRLNDFRSDKKPLNVLIQINLQNEPNKSGIQADNLEALTDHISNLENLRLRGIMLIPKNETEFSAQRLVFKQASDLQHNLKGLPYLDQLSMGMSSDLEAAIAEGATQVRIGTAIFGQRPV